MDNYLRAFLSVGGTRAMESVLSVVIGLGLIFVGFRGLSARMSKGNRPASPEPDRAGTASKQLEKATKDKRDRRIGAWIAVGFGAWAMYACTTGLGKGLDEMAEERAKNQSVAEAIVTIKRTKELKFGGSFFGRDAGWYRVTVSRPLSNPEIERALKLLAGYENPPKNSVDAVFETAENTWFGKGQYTDGKFYHVIQNSSRK